jgi:hypothetical protein
VVSGLILSRFWVLFPCCYLSADEADVGLAGGAPDVGEKLLKCEGNAVVTLGVAHLVVQEHDAGEGPPDVQLLQTGVAGGREGGGVAPLGVGVGGGGGGAAASGGDDGSARHFIRKEAVKE